MSTLRSESGGFSSKSVYGSYCFVHDRKPCRCNSNSSSQELAPDMQSWLNHRGIGRCYFDDQLNVLDPEVKLLTASCVKGNVKGIKENQLIEEYYTTYSKNDAAFSSDMQSKHFGSHYDSFLQEFESTINDDLLSKTHLMDLESCNCVFLERPKKPCSDMDSHWVGLKNIEPWWHAAEKDDIASFYISQRSSHHIRNSDLPGIQTTHVKEALSNCVNGFDQVKTLDKATKDLHVADSDQDDPGRVSMVKTLDDRGFTESMFQESDGNFSGSAKVDSYDTHEPTSGDLSREELLKALCHSQTRAREAEKSAQEACDEKHHVINLFFQQASCLFAYRQWLRMLQLERLCFQLKSKDQIASFTTPTLLPRKGMVLRRNRHRAAKKKPCRQRCCMRKCGIAFAVGLSLAGAGLFVGWTVGWLFPTF